MRYYRFTHVWVLVLFASVIAVAGLKSGRAARRTQNTPGSPPASVRVDKTGVVGGLPAATKPASGAGGKNSDFPGFDAAASRNSELQTSLVWSFGGKQQRGWSLYVPLIANLTGSDANATDRAFAMRLSLWQKQNSIEPNGVLDGDTWSRMISAFQSQRINIRSNPASGKLVIIPTGDCYDPTREEELRKVDPETFAAYKRMIAAAAADQSLGLQVTGKDQLAAGEKFLKVVSAFRSREYQDQLRKHSPNSGRAGLAINSPHSTGRALDLYVGGDPVSTKDGNRALQTETPVYRWLVKNARRFGFQPYFYEPWHWEYVGADSDAVTRDGVTR